MPGMNARGTSILKKKGGRKRVWLRKGCRRIRAGKTRKGNQILGRKKHRQVRRFGVGKGKKGRKKDRRHNGKRKGSRVGIGNL